MLKVKKNKTRSSGMVVHSCNLSNLGGRGGRIISSRSVSARIVRLLSPKQNKSQRIGGITQVVEHLSNMCEALGSICSIRKKKKLKDPRYA
jgi:hypothetical protein